MAVESSTLHTGDALQHAVQGGKKLASDYSSRESEMLHHLAWLNPFGVTLAADAFITAAPVRAKKQVWSVDTGRYVDRMQGQIVEASDEAPIMYLNIVMPRCDGTLEDWIKSRMASYASINASQETRIGRCCVARDLILQLLQALRDVHLGGVAHRDLKPANVLLSRREVETDAKLQQRFPLEHEPAFLLKLADFGSAKDVQDGSKCTPYVTTRWYRAPEILLGSTQYGTPVDMWAFGSIVAQLFLVSPLFCAMRSDGEQTLQHATLLGLPSDSDLLAMKVPGGTTRGKSRSSPASCLSRIQSNLCAVIQRARRARPNSGAIPPQKVFAQLVRHGVPPCVAKLSLHCLHWDPSQRATAEQCLQNCDWLYGPEQLDEVQVEPPVQFGVPPAWAH